MRVVSILLLVTLLCFHARPSLAEEPPPAMTPLSMTGDAADPDLARARRMKSAGVILTSFGIAHFALDLLFAGMHLAISSCVGRPEGCKDGMPIFLIAMGPISAIAVITSAVGIPLWAVGASRERAAAGGALSRVTLAPLPVPAGGGLQLHWRF